MGWSGWGGVGGCVGGTDLYVLDEAAAASWWDFDVDDLPVEVGGWVGGWVGG